MLDAEVTAIAASRLAAIAAAACFFPARGREEP
jgi:hypothetical protein